MVMWEEAMGASSTLQNLTDPFFMTAQLQQLDEMIDQSLNHASIMTWAWFNDGPSDDERACPAYAAMANRAQARDPSRFVTYASRTIVILSRFVALSVSPILKASLLQTRRRPPRTNAWPTSA